MSLQLDHEACEQSRAALTSPRTRLGVEMAWLPGVSPTKALQLAAQVLVTPLSIRMKSGLPALAHANLMAAAFEILGVDEDPQSIAKFIQQLACLVDTLSADDAIRDINEDRTISGFPAVKTDQVEAELAERRRYYRKAIKDSLNRLPSSSLVEAMTLAVDSATRGGKDHAPELIDELVDSYEVESQEFLQKEAENVHALIKATHDSAPSGENAIKLLVRKLDLVVRNWDKIAQPIQLSAKARGTEHVLSNQLAYSIRSLAVDLFNKHNLLAPSQHLTGLLQELFSELPELTERVEQDADALQQIFQTQKQTEAQREEWARTITYQVEFGTIFKHALSISPEGVTWKNKGYPLETITRVRWGGVHNSTYGISTGTMYTLAFGDNRSEAVVELKQEDIFATLVDKLWQAVGVRLLLELLNGLQSGKEITFRDARVRDDRVLLSKHRMFGKDSVWCMWGQTHIWIADGNFYIGSKDNEKIYISLSYIQDSNTHVLEHAVRMAFKKPGLSRLSEVLDG